MYLSDEEEGRNIILDERAMAITFPLGTFDEEPATPPSP